MCSNILLTSQVSTVEEGPFTHSTAIVPVSEVVVWLPPAQLLGCCRDCMLLILGTNLPLSQFVQLLVLAVLAEVLLVIRLLKHFSKSKCLRLLLLLFHCLCLHDVVFLEVMPVRVLALQERQFLLNFLPSLSYCVTIFFLHAKHNQ